MRATLTPDRLREVRQQMTAMKSPNRWPSAQQGRYLEICLKQEATEPSVNQRTCECELEVMMNRYPSFVDLVKDFMNGGASSDERTAGLVGMCVASFGS